MACHGLQSPHTCQLLTADQDGDSVQSPSGHTAPPETHKLKVSTERGHKKTSLIGSYGGSLITINT